METSETKSKAIRGNVIMDKELLSECISKSAICSTCKKSKSKLELWKVNKNNGLAEQLLLICSVCKKQTLLETSKKMASERQDGRGAKSAFEVNRRSVSAGLSIGRAGLIKYCADMDLSPPVHIEPYNVHLKNIEKLPQ